MGKVFEAILKRRSIRKYKSEEVPQDKIKKVLEAANWAPSNPVRCLQERSLNLHGVLLKIYAT